MPLWVCVLVVEVQVEREFWDEYEVVWKSRLRKVPSLPGSRRQVVITRSPRIRMVDEKKEDR